MQTSYNFLAFATRFCRAAFVLFFLFPQWVGAQSESTDPNVIPEQASLQHDQAASQDQAAVPDLVIFDDYFKAHDKAVSSGKHLLLFRHHAEEASPEEIEFEQVALKHRGLRRLLAERFILVKSPIGDPIQITRTVQRSGYVRRRFYGQVRKTWTETVRTNLFAKETDVSGLLVVRITDSDYESGSEALAHFPFGQATLSPRLFKWDEALKPWEPIRLYQIASTPIGPRSVYLPAVTQSLGLRSEHYLSAPSVETVRFGGIAYDYSHSLDNIRADGITTRISLGGHDTLVSHEGPIDTRVDVYSLKNSAVPVSYVYRQLEPTDEWQPLEVDGLQPETPYRLQLYFYDSDPKHALLGQASLPMDCITGGTTRLAEARAAVAMSALREVHDWDRGYTRGKPYVIGRWCERFYWWNFVDRFYTPYPYGYNQRTFSNHGAIVSGGALREMARTGNIAGDHVRVSGHGFMVFSFDEHLGQAWTIEGNFGNRAVLTRRDVQNYWTVGTLVESMLKEPAEAEPTVTVALSEQAPEREEPTVSESETRQAERDSG